MTSLEKEQIWIQAIKEEFNLLVENEIWEY